MAYKYVQPVTVPYVGLLLLSLISYGAYGVARAAALCRRCTWRYRALDRCLGQAVHDQDRPGLLALANLIPSVGWTGVYIFMLIPGKAGDNQYGPDPLGAEV